MSHLACTGPAPGGTVDLSVSTREQGGRTIVEVGGVPETAAVLGIAETTAKTHLHRVFAKTGVSRQADLVKLAAGFSNPLVN